MLGNGYLHVRNSKMTAQVHLYQLCEYKRMMRQAMHNILHKETFLYQLLLGLNSCHVTRLFEVYHCSQIYGNIYYQTLHKFLFPKNCWLVFSSSHSMKALPKTFYFSEFVTILHTDLGFSALVS